MVIELHHTVVAHIAMSRADGPENKASLTELELADHLVAMLSLTCASENVGDALLFDLDSSILLIDEVIRCRCIQKSRYDTRVLQP
jgi:hypothetical protein